jgi:hypothetical protein
LIDEVVQNSTNTIFLPRRSLSKNGSVLVKPPGRTNSGASFPENGVGVVDTSAPVLSVGFLGSAVQSSVTALEDDAATTESVVEEADSLESGEFESIPPSQYENPATTAITMTRGMNCFCERYMMME